MCQQWKWRINHANQSQYYANVFAGRVLRDPCVPTLDQGWNTGSAAKCGAYCYTRHTLYLHSATFHRNIVLFRPATTVKILLAHHHYSVRNPINQTEMSVGLSYSARRNRSTLCRRNLFFQNFAEVCFSSGAVWNANRCFCSIPATFISLPLTSSQPFSLLSFSCWQKKKRKRETILNVRTQTTRGIWIFEDVCSDKSLIMEWC